MNRAGVGVAQPAPARCLSGCEGITFVVLASCCSLLLYTRRKSLKG